MREIRTGKPTEEEVEEIAALLRTKKYGARQIGEIVGRTKGSIMGILWRTPRLKAIGLPHTTLVERLIKAKKAKKAPFEPEKELPPMPEPVIEIGPRPLMRLRDNHCRFPLWDHNAKPKIEEMLFCAEAKLPDGPYCDKHHKLCVSMPYQKVIKTKQVA